MIGSKISSSLVLAIQLAFLFIPEIRSLAPPNGHQPRGQTTSLGNSNSSVPSETPASRKKHTAERPISMIAAVADSSRKYIVILKDEVEVPSFVSRLKASFDSDNGAPVQENQIGYVYEDPVLHGFSAQLTKKVFKKLSENPEVQELIPDSMLSVQPIERVLADESILPGLLLGQTDSPSVETDGASDSNVQKKTAPWGLQRIDQRRPISPRTSGNNAALIDYDYAYSQSAGQGVTVYILDTGARKSHVDFEGRVEMVAQFGGYDLDDGNGHGTHCAGTVAGARWGVAKKVKVRAVKVLADDGSGSTSDVIAGIQYTMQQYRASGYKPTVASLSLGGDRNSALDRAVQAAINQGIHFAVAAGNSNADACLSSPSSVAGANVIAASDIKDNRASYSNWGACVDLIAPGSDVTSAWYTSDDAIKRISGTSMATPHVAGLIAVYLSQKNLTTQQMTEKLKREATSNAIYLGPKGSNASSTPNLLLYNSLQ